MSYADLLTVLRLVLVPFFLYAFLTESYSNALILFAFAGGTDLIDGTVARLTKRQTQFGAILDPVADKVLMGATFACLWSAHIVPAWFFLLVFSRDVMILGGLAYLKWRHAEAQLKPLWTSKIATLLQIGTAVFGMTAFLKPGWILLGKPLVFYMNVCLFSVSFLIIISAVQYCLRGIGILRHV